MYTVCFCLASIGTCGLGTGQQLNAYWLIGGRARSSVVVVAGDLRCRRPTPSESAGSDEPDVRDDGLVDKGWKSIAPISRLCEWSEP